MVTSEKSLVVDLGGLDRDGRRRTGECGVQTRGRMNRIEYRIQVALFIFFLAEIGWMLTHQKTKMMLNSRQHPWSFGGQDNVYRPN